MIARQIARTCALRAAQCTSWTPIALAAVAGAICTPPALASSSSPGVITAMVVEDGKAFFYTAGTRSSDTPSCATVSAPVGLRRVHR